ncbi:MAG TPA: efflux RND transporter periplasmic adaptor subunit [Opitutaceae bacterium]|nr:efflux RND transporter periplasmic adaptor subunit [Opitutaceae bacterium]
MAKSKSYGGLIVLLLVVAAAGAGAWYYFNNKSDKQPDISTTKIARGDIVQAVTATGDLQPVVTVDVGAQVSGQIADVLVDFNSLVKAGDVLAKIDESNAVQKVHQAEADLASAKASNELTRVTAQRTQELFDKKLVSQSELDNAMAQLAQSNATLLTRNAALENAKLDLQHCTITAPIDGIVLNRNTDKGRTVNASTNAPTLFTLVNDLSKMQINAAVAEADVGLVSDGKDVRFTVDAFPSRTFTGVVRQVRNAATVNQNVVSYAVIIDVNNEDQKLKPGMTANVSIVIAERTNVLRIANAALRVRVPQELLPKSPSADKAGATGKAGATMTDDEKRRATMALFTEAGWTRGQPLTPDMIEKAKKAGADKGIDADSITQAAERMQRFAQGGGGGGGGGRRGGGGGGNGGGADRGFGTNTVTNRTVYKIADPNAKDKKLDAVTARLGISDGIFTEVLGGLDEGDTIVTSVTLPGAVMQGPGTQNPFQGQRGFGGGGMGGGGGGGGGRRG